MYQDRWSNCIVQYDTRRMKLWFITFASLSFLAFSSGGLEKCSHGDESPSKFFRRALIQKFEPVIACPLLKYSCKREDDIIDRENITLSLLIRNETEEEIAAVAAEKLKERRCKVPFCNELLTQNYSDYTFYSPPVFLDEPVDVREDHVTFLLGIMVLMLVACGCIFTLSRLTKPRFRINYGTISNYDFMMWMPTKANRRSSVMVLLRGMTCRRTPNDRSSNISVVSSNIGLLPSYQTATSTPTSALSSFPPPPYAETQRLTEENQSL